MAQVSSHCGAEYVILSGEQIREGMVADGCGCSVRSIQGPALGIAQCGERAG